MRYSKVIYNDVANAPGICVSVFTQGCPHHCSGCFNPETWDYEGGQEFTTETLSNIINGLKANGVKRSLSILGGEPLCPENIFLTYLIITEVRKELPDTKVYIWSGYTYEKLLENSNPKVQQILELANVLIDGPFQQELRDITLHMRGSSNQRIIDLETGEVIEQH